MSIKKISKQQPEKFEFNDNNLKMSKKLFLSIQKENNKAL